METMVEKHTTSNLHTTSTLPTTDTLPPKGTTLTQPIIHGNMGHDFATSTTGVVTGAPLTTTSLGSTTFDPNRNLTTTVPTTGTTGTTTGLGATTTGTSVDSTGKKVYVDSKGTPHHGLGAKIHEVKDKITHKHGTTTTGPTTTTTGTGTGTRL